MAHHIAYRVCTSAYHISLWGLLWPRRCVTKVANQISIFFPPFSWRKWRLMIKSTPALYCPLNTLFPLFWAMRSARVQFLRWKTILVFWFGESEGKSALGKAPANHHMGQKCVKWWRCLSGAEVRSIIHYNSSEPLTDYAVYLSIYLFSS